MGLEPRRIGTPATGILDIPILGFLTVQEEDTITELTSEDDSVFVTAAKIAEQIALAESTEDHPVSIAETFAIVEASVSRQPLEPDAEAIRLRHAAQIERVAQLVASVGARRSTATATAIIRHRLNQPSWTVQQTRELPALLRQELSAIADAEQNPHREAVQPPSEEDLKKLPPVSGKRSKQTGAGSSQT